MAIAGLIAVVFFVSHSLGDPVRIMFPPGAPPETLEAARQRLGLNDPLLIQFWNYIKGIPRLDLGTSLWQGVPNTQLVAGRLPATVLLAVAAITWATLAGVAVGTISGMKPGSKLDKALSYLSFLAISSIDFWVALMLIIVVAVQVRWLPMTGYGDALHLILPSLALGFRPFGRIAQVTRPAVIDEFNKPYVLALKARGLSDAKVVYHVLHNASIVIVTLAGYEFARLFYGGTVVVETVFGWPGVGRLMVEAVQQRDWTLMVAGTVIVASLVIIFHLLMDIVYGLLDPRVRLEDEPIGT